MLWHVLIFLCAFCYLGNTQAIVFPDQKERVLQQQILNKPPEACPGNLTFCGGDESKFPINAILELVNSLEEVKFSDTVKNRFFSTKEDEDTEVPVIKLRNAELTEELEYACEVTKSTIPNYARVKNVDKQWKYLAQISKDYTQRVQVVQCKNPEQPCENDEDNPGGKGNTVCKQIFSTQKLLVIDATGNVTVDSIEIPSACLCHAVSNFGSSIRRSSLFQTFGKNDCKSEGSLKKSDLKGEEGTAFDKDSKKKKNPKLAQAAKSISECANSEFDTMCPDETDYPKDEIKNMLEQHALFSDKDYFNRLFGTPCRDIEKELAKFTLRTGLNFDEEKVCTAKEKFEYPRKGKTINGKWKYIVNTEDYQQGISVHKCIGGSFGESCKYNGSPGNYEDATRCNQIYKKHSFLMVNEDGSLGFEDFQVPTACACQILEKEWLDDRDRQRDRGSRTLIDDVRGRK